MRLRKLRTLIERGAFAIPELQREFVWSPRKVCDLLDSICRGYPIGTILLWKTNRRNEGQLRKKFHILPPFNAANKHILFLIDGQQRLSVLWHLLSEKPSVVSSSNGREINFGHVYFDPHARAGEERFLYRRRLPGDLAKRLIPVVDLLSSVWHHRIRGHGPRVMKRLRECRKAVQQYRAILVYCETNSLTDVRETFIRINSQGMRISVADRAFARASKFDLRGLVRDAQARLEHGFGQLSRSTILQTIALALGARDLGERAIDSMVSRLERSAEERARFERDWPSLREAFASAADFLVGTLGVPSYEFLPSEPMMSILTLFFFYNDNSRPYRAVQRRLQQWFWATAVAARYTGRGYRPNLLSDAQYVARLATSPKAKAHIKPRVPVYQLRNTEFGRPGPLSNAFFCLLRQNKPRYLDDGSAVPPMRMSSRSNRQDKHHIFPRALLLHHGIGPDRFNSILNICYLVAKENQRVGKRAPRQYLQAVPRNDKARRRAMRSHFIPATDERGVWDRSIKRGFKDFQNDRADLLVKAFEQQAQMRLFERA